MKKLLFVGILTAFFSVACSEETATNSVSDNTKSEAPSESEEKNSAVKMGSDLNVEGVVFKVNSTEEVTEISTADGFMKYVPESEGAVFYLVNVTLKNEKNEMITTDSSFFKLISDNGAEYSPTMIITTGDDSKFFTYDGINPGLSLSGNIAFEVPPGLTNLKLKVQTGFWGTETGIIELY